MKATDEQIRVCTSNAQVMKIKAGAGTGKTTTLRGLAAQHRSDRILYLAFNKAIKEEAQGKFVSNVRAMTAHGLAYSQVGKHYGNTPDKLLSGDLKPFHVLPGMGASLKSIPKNLHNLYGGRVIETIKTFLVSPSMEMAEEHLIAGGSPAERKYFAPYKILGDAQHLWESMQDLASPIPMTHDGYLKLFQLSEPDLGYDMILLDEAQDTNPVTQALVEIQDGRRVYVGDEHQAIYGFRGARNAMAIIRSDEDFLLTGSFRFGPAIANLANAILEAKGEQELRLRGLGPSSVLGVLPLRAPHAFIARGNTALFYRAVQALEHNEAFAFVGPLYNYRFDLIEQTYRLSIREPVSDPFLKAFASFEDLEAYAEAMEDREIKGRCKLVTRYGGRIPALVRSIQARAGTFPSAKPFQVILTSAHRSKGLEFDQVQMADDFMDFFDDDQGVWKDFTQGSHQDLEEVNLQYVAATRAKKHLEIGAKLELFWQHSQEAARKLARAGQPALTFPVTDTASSVSAARQPSAPRPKTDGAPATAKPRGPARSHAAKAAPAASTPHSLPKAKPTPPTRPRPVVTPVLSRPHAGTATKRPAPSPGGGRPSSPERRGGKPSVARPARAESNPATPAPQTKASAARRPRKTID